MMEIHYSINFRLNQIMRLLKSTFSFIGLILFCLCPAAIAYEPIKAEKGVLLFEDDFSRSKLGDKWTSHPNSFFIEESAMRATQLKDAGHGAVTRAIFNFKDVWISFDFKYEGGERFNFVVDDKNDKSVHAGHISRLTMNKHRLIVQDDKTGTMNLVIRKQRLSGDSSPELEKLLETKRSEVDFDFKDGQWYHMEVLIKGDRMEVHLDGKFLVGHQSDGFAHPTKTQFVFTVTGQSIYYDNVEAWSLK